MAEERALDGILGDEYPFDLGAHTRKICTSSADDANTWPVAIWPHGTQSS